MVQRVGFRAFVTTQACSLGVAGHVFNRPDGAVELVAEGTPEQLAELERQLRRGPPLSRVSEVSSTDEAAQDRRGFDVRR
jgi:acylphosphatase